MTHRRVPPLELLPVKDLRVDPNRPEDEEFQKRYRNYLLGKLTASWTRLHVDKITCGFFRRSDSSQVELIVEDTTDKFTEVFAYGIHQGDRPNLFVYRSPFHPGENRFVCSDDTYAYAAYKRVGITSIPCVVLSGSASGFDESAICVRVADQKVRQLHSSIPIEVTNYPSFVSKLQDLRGSLLKLVEIASETKGQIRRFHIPGESRTHYHQSLYSIVHRHEETISSILDLLLAKRNQQAVALTRMLYEGFLNFYIDWLSPEHVGPMLQLAALVRRRQLFGDDGNPSEDKAPNIDDVLGKGFADLIQTTAHKARISPLGAHFHELVYPWLSFAAHQDYGTTQEHSSLLEHSFDESEANLPDKLVLWIDVITAALVVRVLADVGSSVDSLPSFAARK